MDDEVEIEVWRRRLPDGLLGVCLERGREQLIVVDDRLDGPELRVVVEHEREHLRRGLRVRPDVVPEGWGPVEARWEASIDRAVAERLIPAVELARFVAEMCGEAVTAADVARRFGVTCWLCRSHPSMAGLVE